MILLGNIAPTYAHVDAEWASLSETTSFNSGYTTRTPSDTWRARTTMVWDAARTAGLRHAETHGYRFSQDTHDLSCNLNATTRRETNLPNPYFDLDYKGCCPTPCALRGQEAEVTSENSLFPTAGTSYYTHFYYMRWNQQGGNWVWDPDGGTLSYDEQLSSQQPIGDKWDAADIDRCCANIRVINYAYAPPPGTSATAGSPELASPDTLDLQAASPTAEAATMATPYTLERAGNQVFARPLAEKGLYEYAAVAHELGGALVAVGPARGIATFSYPLTPADLRELEALGLVIETYEAVSEPTADSTRWTMFNAFTPAAHDEIADFATENTLVIDGIVSATVVVPDRSTLQAAIRSPKVFMIDLAPEQIRRSLGRDIDLEMNDRFWVLAGW